MDTEERVLTALRCEEPDRVPVFIYLNPYMGSVRDESYSQLLGATREYADVIYDQYFSRDVSPIPNKDLLVREFSDGRIVESIQTPKGELCRIQRKPRGVQRYFVESVDDIEKLLSIPYQQTEPDIARFLQMREKLRGKAVAQATLPDPVCMIGGLFRPEFLCTCTITHRDLLLEMAEIFYRRISALLTCLLENDVGPIYYFNGPEYALPPLMSPEDFDDFVVAYDSRLISQIHEHGKYTIIHSHGRVGAFLERFAEIGPNGLNVLEPPPHGNVILKDAKERFGKKMCLIGNIQYEEFANYSTNQMEQRVWYCIHDAAEGGGFILSPCASPYEFPIPKKTAENFIHYLKMGRKYGRYPIT
jgi:hypothetical protein